jgi:hypothetical protein
MNQIKVPVCYFIFNRPTFTNLSFSIIKSQRPEKLFIIADGPRSQIETDKVNCAAVRQIVEKIDWPCQVFRDFSATNLGAKKRISSGLNWVFSHVDRAVILEDDCLAHTDFFRFCEVLLDRYETDERVFTITGNNFQGGRSHGESSYYFSRHPHSWGWATWRRAWRHYQEGIPFWPEWSGSPDWFSKYPERVERRYWKRIFDKTYSADPYDAWDYPWTACVRYRGGLCATPNVNLVTNIGFGSAATNTLLENDPCANIETVSIGCITHPSRISHDVDADAHAFNVACGGRDLRFPRIIYHWIRLARKIVKHRCDILMSKLSTAANSLLH